MQQLSIVQHNLNRRMLQLRVWCKVVALCPSVISHLHCPPALHFSQLTHDPPQYHIILSNKTQVFTDVGAILVEG